MKVGDTRRPGDIHGVVQPRGPRLNPCACYHMRHWARLGQRKQARPGQDDALQEGGPPPSEHAGLSQRAYVSTVSQ